MNGKKDDLPEGAREVLERYLAERLEVTYPDPMLPPWKAYPEYAKSSLGWKMGQGEDYRRAFFSWFSGLSVEKRKDYAALNPEPESWAGYYDDFETVLSRRNARK